MFGCVLLCLVEKRKRSTCVTKDVKKKPTTRPEIPKYSNIILKKKSVAMIYNFSQQTRHFFFVNSSPFAPPPTDV